jgi:hypothetical protein
MKKITTGILILMAIINYSCNNNDLVDPLTEELEQFKNQTIIQFSGQVLGYDIYWKFGNWNNGIGGYGESFWCLTDSKKIQQRNFSIYDYEQRDYIISLKIKSPAFSIDSSLVFKKTIFETGRKALRSSSNSIYEGFEIQGNSKDACFSSLYGEQNASSFEIIKVQELTPDDPEKDYKKLRLWIVVSCNLFQCEGQKIGMIKGGKFIAEIELERNE